MGNEQPKMTMQTSNSSQSMHVTKTNRRLFHGSSDRQRIRVPNKLNKGSGSFCSVSLTNGSSPSLPSLNMFSSTGSVLYSNSVPMMTLDNSTDNIEHNNGVTGVYISLPIVDIVHLFWQKHITPLRQSDKLEIACNVFFEMMHQDSECRAFLRNRLKTNAKIEALSIRFLDMIEWIIRMLLTNNIPLVRILKDLGTLHQKMGVGITHFRTMLQALHSTLSHYFERHYSIQERFAMDRLIGVSAEIMTGKKFGNDGFKTTSLNECLRSDVGKQYIFTFLRQRYCDEIVIFLDFIAKYRAAMSCKQRFMIAREIVKDTINPNAAHSVNISSDTRNELLHKMTIFEVDFKANHNCKNNNKNRGDFNVPVNLFDQCFVEIRNLIMINQWSKFVRDMQSLKKQSMIGIHLNI